VQGIPKGFNDVKKLFRDVRKGMGIREEKDMGHMDDFETLRDMYLVGKIWNTDDLVEANGIEGRVVNRGTNYLSYCDGTGKVHKAWLHEIDLDERNYAKEYANYQGTPEQIARRSSRNKARRVMGDKTKIGMDVGHKDNNPLNNDPKNLRNEDPSKNRREPRLREKDDLDEMSWFLKLKAKIDQVTHPTNYDDMIKDYLDRVIKTKGKPKRVGAAIVTNQPSGIAAAIARKNNVSSRSLIMYINKLVDKGVIPKELKAELQIETFKGFVEQIEEACWDGYKQVGMKKKGDKEVPNCVPEENELNEWGEITEVDDKSGKELNNPTKGDVKKYKVYVKNAKGNVVKVEFGDPNMSIKRDDPAARKNFRARHNCDQKKDKTTAGYWSCKFWSTKSVTDLMKG